MTPRFVDTIKVVQGLAPITPSTSTPDYVSLKNYDRMAIVINVDNGTTVTGSAISLRQATDVSDGSGKALAFSTMWANTDTGAADTLVETAVTSDTFTTDATNAKNLVYVIEINSSSLDRANGFDCVRLVTGNGANMVLGAMYYLYDARYKSPIAVSAITD